jgi:hypothetical protein
MAYGATGDGVTDDTLAIQACIDATRSSTLAGVSGSTVYFPAGEYRITDTLNFYRFSGVVEGEGVGNSWKYTPSKGNSSVIRWDGGNTKSMLRLQDYSDVRISTLRLEGKNSAKPTYGIESYCLAADQHGHSSRLHVSDVYIGRYAWCSTGLFQGDMQAGIGFTGDNGNNDQWSITNCAIVGADVGLDLPNSQSIWGRISDTTIYSASVAGIRTSATLTATNLRFQKCATDLLVNDYASVWVHGLFTENSGQIIRVTHIGRVSVYGGILTLHTTLGTKPFIQHDKASGHGGIMLHDVDINTSISPHPKIKMVSTGGGVGSGRLTMEDCKSVMTLADFDVTTTGGNSIVVNLNSGAMRIDALNLSNGQAL